MFAIIDLLFVTTNPRHENIVVDIFDKKVAMLKNFFFLPLSEANLSDLNQFVYHISSECFSVITEREVLQAIRRPKADKALGPDEITNRVIQAYALKLALMLTSIFQACVDNTYHPYAYKCAHTIILKKPQKDNYTSPKTWRPIALLNTTRKILEFIMVIKISYLMKQY